MSVINKHQNEYVDVDQIIETEEPLSDDAIIEMVRPNISDPPQPESDDDTSASPPGKTSRTC